MNHHWNGAIARPTFSFMKPVVVINRLAIKPGSMDAFVETQRAFAASLPPCGLVGGRMYRSEDGRSAVLVSVFDSKEAQEAILERPDFKAHFARLRSLVESSSPVLFEEAYTTGRFV
ncbi:MAG TPA: antibiotic biosynthesis monooxygenase [Labilithrix sp.]|jgi:heme-degrading monooxygenase HmoA